MTSPIFFIISSNNKVSGKMTNCSPHIKCTCSDLFGDIRSSIMEIFNSRLQCHSGSSDSANLHLIEFCHVVRSRCDHYPVSILPPIYFRNCYWCVTYFCWFCQPSLSSCWDCSMHFDFTCYCQYLVVRIKIGINCELWVLRFSKQNDFKIFCDFCNSVSCQNLTLSDPNSSCF